MKNFEALARETFAQKIREALIFFDREDMRAGIERELGESAQTRPDFNYEIVMIQIRFLDDPPSQVTVVEKILPQGFYRRHPNLAQRRVDLRELHRRMLRE